MRTFHQWGDLVFIMGHHDQFHSWMMIQNDNFLSWMMIRHFSHLVRDFLSLIINRLIRDNLWAIIRKYPTSLIGGGWVFSFSTSSLIILPAF